MNIMIVIMEKGDHQMKDKEKKKVQMKDSDGGYLFTS